MSTFPPLPEIEGDVELLLDVFTHSSLRISGAPLNEDYGDTDRLAELGAGVLQFVVATHWFHSKAPRLPVAELKVKTQESLDAWMRGYGLETKLRIAPPEMDSIDPEKERRRMFETYVGAVYFRNRNGLQEIQHWISKLIDSSDAPATSPEILDHSLRCLPVPPHAPYSDAPVPPPPPPRSPRPPIPRFHPYERRTPAYNSSLQRLKLVSVALLNQKATRNDYQVTYPTEQSGPPHAPTWNIGCCLNGKEYGRGTGNSYKVAKEEAARGAWFAMGW